MDKLAVLSEIHGLVQVVLETPDSAFSDPDKKADLVENLAEYYVAIATDKTAAVIAQKYTACRAVIDQEVQDADTKDRLDREIDDINDDIQPAP